MRVACDVTVPQIALVQLEAVGHPVVYRAQHRQPDIEWVTAGYRRGAKLFLSSDLGVHEQAAKFGRDALALPRGLGGQDLARWLCELITQYATRTSSQWLADVNQYVQRHNWGLPAGAVLPSRLPPVLEHPRHTTFPTLRIELERLGLLEEDAA